MYREERERERNVSSKGRSSAGEGSILINRVARAPQEGVTGADR